jgi:purine-binding chemotaxis protein CheW
VRWSKMTRNNSCQGRLPASAVEEKQYLTFMLGGEMFSLSILCIKEIIWYANLTEVPMMPACIRGVINLRGAVVPVLDLSSRFGKPSTPVTKSTCIVIMEVETATEGERQNMGVVVDSVQAVLEIPPARSSRRRALAPRSAASSLRALARSTASL